MTKAKTKPRPKLPKKPKLPTRTIRVPIAEVDGDKRQFYAELRESLRLCCQFYNRCLTECAVVDREAWTRGRDGKVPKLPEFDPYVMAKRADEFDGAKYQACTLARAAWKDYKQKRFAILTGQASLPLQRSCPLPLAHNSRNIEIKIDDPNEGGAVWARVKLLSGTRWRVKLRGGSNYRKALRGIHAAEAYGDSKIWLDRRGQAVLGIATKRKPDHQPGRKGTLRVRTDRTAFIVATKASNERPFTINADHVKRWLAERNRKQQRLRQDSKSGQTRTSLKDVRARIARKFDDRLRSFIHEATAHIVQHARRRRVARVEYDATVKSYFGPFFPYYQISQQLAYKCQDAGIEFVERTAQVQPAVENEPHVYFALGVDRLTGQPRNVKIGKTQRAAGVRQGDDAFAKDQDWVILATHATTAAKLHKQETAYKAQFQEHRINGETFEREPIIEWLRETAMLGNSGNLSQIAQHLEIQHNEAN